MVRWILVLTWVLAHSFTWATDIPVRYLVMDRDLRDAVAGTVLTFELFGDSACTVPPLHSQNIAIENINDISRLKRFEAPRADRPPKTAELVQTLTGVSASGNVYAKVSGIGVTPVGGACQAQAASQAGGSGSPAPFVKDGNRLVVGALAGSDLALRKVCTTIVGLPFRPNNLSQPCLYFVAADCTGPPLIQSSGVVNFAERAYRSGSLYYAIGVSRLLFTASVDCGTGCVLENQLLSQRVAAPPVVAPMLISPFTIEIP